MFLTQLGLLAIRKGVPYNDDSLRGHHWACKCAGCLVRIEHHVVFEVSYCSRECHAWHWDSHRASCTGLLTVNAQG